MLWADHHTTPLPSASNPIPSSLLHTHLPTLGQFSNLCHVNTQQRMSVWDNSCTQPLINSFFYSDHTTTSLLQTLLHKSTNACQT